MVKHYGGHAERCVGIGSGVVSLIGKRTPMPEVPFSHDGQDLTFRAGETADEVVLRPVPVLPWDPSHLIASSLHDPALDLPGDGGGLVVHYAAARSKAMGLM